MTELKPCPFCGSSDVGKECDGSFGCLDCGARPQQSHSRATDDERAEKWNTRPSPWRSLKDEPPTDNAVRVIVLRCPLPSDPRDVTGFTASGYMYRFVKRRGKWTDWQGFHVEFHWAHWMEIPA